MRLVWLLLALLLLAIQPASADLLSALVAIEDKDYPKAIRELEPLAKKGDAQPRYLLGKLLLEGWGGSDQVDRGIGLMKQAAEQDFGPAQAMLGFLYARGIGVPVDRELAEKWLTRSLDRLGRGPVRANAEATLAALQQGGDMGPPPTAAPVPQVTEQPIPPVEPSETTPSSAVAEAAEGPPPASTEANPAETTQPDLAQAAMAPTDEQKTSTPSMEGAASPTMTAEGSIIGSAEITGDQTAQLATDVEPTEETSVGSAATDTQEEEVTGSNEPVAPMPEQAPPVAEEVVQQSAQPEHTPQPTTEQTLAPMPQSVEISDNVRTHSEEREAALSRSKEHSLNTEIAARPSSESAPPAQTEEHTTTKQSTIQPDKTQIAAAPTQASDAITPTSVPDIAPELAPATAAIVELPPPAPPPSPPPAPPAEMTATKSAEPAAIEAKTAKTNDNATAKKQSSDGIRIQLAAVPNRDLAEAEWKRIVGRNPKLLAGREPIFKTIDLGAQGVFHRIQTGPFKDLSEARSLCAKLIESGQDCIVMTK